jgi:fructose-1,6-bisphosphatase I
LGGDRGAQIGAANADGDEQRRLDVVADGLFMAALRKAPVAAVVSEESEKPVLLRSAAPLVVSIDPLDGSSNLDVNAPVGTIFSIGKHLPGEAPVASFLRPGNELLAAGFFIYGTQTSLVVSVGSGVQLLTLDPATKRFVLVRPEIVIPGGVREYAINASNYRHWNEGVQRYIDDCIQGADGPRGQNFNMRWIASLVADSYRIFMRGGVFLYPADRRKGYGQGRLRHLYEANPIAFLANQAGGSATDAVNPILDLMPAGIHERVPFVMGSPDKVQRIRDYHTDPASIVENSPLFGRRGLLRA